MVIYPLPFKPSHTDVESTPKNVLGYSNSKEIEKGIKFKIACDIPNQDFVMIFSGNNMIIRFFFTGKLILRSLILSVSSGNCVHFKLK